MDWRKPLLAAMDMPDPVTKLQLLTALGARNDLSLLANRTETNPLPTSGWGWSPETSPPVAAHRRGVGIAAHQRLQEVAPQCVWPDSLS